MITDAVMPEMNGYDFVTAVRTNPRRADLPILMLTRKRHRQDVKKAVEAGVTDYILKPIDENLLIEKVEACLRKGGKPATREVSLHGADATAEIGVSCRLVSMSDSGITLRLPFKLEPRAPIQLRSRIFTEIGIDQPLLKVERCEKSGEDDSLGDLPWQARTSFAQIQDSDLHKVRAWLQQQSGPKLK